MRLFKRKKEEFKPQRNDLFDIPVGSMVELSDIATFNLEEKTSQTYELRAYKKYEADGFLRFMYDLVNDEEVILGVDVDLSSDDCNIARFVVDSEEEFTEPLGDIMVMEFEDPENSGETAEVKYYRNNIINTKMTTVTSDGFEEYYDIELQDFSSDDGSILTAELWDLYFTFYLGEPIQRANVNIFPINPNEKK